MNKEMDFKVWDRIFSAEVFFFIIGALFGIVLGVII